MCTLRTGYDAFTSVVLQRVYVFTCPSNSLTIWSDRYCACLLSVNAIMPARNKNTNVHVRINTCRTSYGWLLRLSDMNRPEISLKIFRKNLKGHISLKNLQMFSNWYSHRDWQADERNNFYRCLFGMPVFLKTTAWFFGRMNFPITKVVAVINCSVLISLNLV